MSQLDEEMALRGGSGVGEVRNGNGSGGMKVRRHQTGRDRGAEEPGRIASGSLSPPTTAPVAPTGRWCEETSSTSAGAAPAPTENDYEKRKDPDPAMISIIVMDVALTFRI